MIYLIVILFWIGIAILSWYTIKKRREYYTHTKKLFLNLNPISELLNFGFENNGFNLIYRKMNSCEIGIYYHSNNNKLVLYSFINGYKWDGLKHMNKFNSKYKSENIVADSKKGFAQKLGTNPSIEEIQKSFERLIDILKTEI